MDLERLILGCRGLRISCWIVGIPVLSPFRNTCVDARLDVRLILTLYASAKRNNRIRPQLRERRGLYPEDRDHEGPDLDHFSTEFDGGANPNLPR